MNKELRQIKRIAEAQGWTVFRTKGGHYRWVPPRRDVPFVVTASTPSDSRAVKNIKARLRKAGLAA